MPASRFALNVLLVQSDLNLMLENKRSLQPHKQSSAALTLERSQLNAQRTLALRRHDDAEVAELDAKILELNGRLGQRPQTTGIDELAKLNERNRKANAEAVRKAELWEAERKRRERKRVQANGTAPQDPSARLKTVPRVFNAATPSSRFVAFSSFTCCYMRPMSFVSVPFIL